MGSSAPRSKKETIARLIAIAILVIATVAVLYCSEYFVRRFWDPVVDVKFPNTAFCFSIILILLLGFLDGFDFGGKRMYSLLYAISLALFLTSIITLALPYVVIGRQVSKKVMLVHFLVMLVLSPFWVKLSTAIYFKFCPPLKSLFISDMPSERWVLEKINGYGKKYLIEKTISPKTLDIEQHIQQFSVVIIGNIDMLDKQMILAICASLNKQVLLRPNFTDIMRAGAQAEQFDDLLLLSLSSFDLTSGDRFKKRLFDILFSFTGVVLSLPILLICAILVFLEDRHNPFYLQKRLTKGGRAFNIIKLRTMIPNAEKKDGPVLATEDDPRITKIGRVLRAFRLDEIHSCSTC